jgi:NAD(P)-dependent dehydrogenase (short-subunit alcohol dehydrogenase family)
MAVRRAGVTRRRSLEGRPALITGASQGIGLAIARAFVEAGADVFLCARDAHLLEQARAELAALAGGRQAVLAFAADVSNRDHVARLAAAALEAFPRLQILVNNAGVQGPLGLVEDADWDQWVRAIEINLMGSVLMCRSLLPHFKSQRSGKIIQLSGGGATSPMPHASAYAASKAAIVRFVETLAEEVHDDGIDVNAIAPGAVNTRLLEGVLAAGPDRVGEKMFARAIQQKEEGGAPADQAAALAVFLGSAASDGITGKLVSAVWDPWEQMRTHLADLDGSDVYTLRRIVPSDRGLTWGRGAGPVRTARKTRQKPPNRRNARRRKA